jgi:hypothetical protein
VIPGAIKAAGLALALANLKRRVRALALKGMLAGLGLVLMTAAAAFLLVALHTWLSGRYGPVVSASAIGGVLLLIGLVLLFVASRPLKPERGAVEATAARLGRTVSDTMDQLAGGTGPAGSPLHNPLLLAVGVAAMAGFLLGRRRTPKKD